MDKLRWHAAVVECDAGVHVEVTDGAMSRMVRGKWRRVPNMYSAMVGRAGIGAYTYNEMWVFLNGVSTGATQSRVISREDNP